MKTGRSVEHRCEGEHRVSSHLAAEQPKQQAQQNTNYDRCHDGDVDLNMSPLDDDITGQLSESKLFRQQPCRADGNQHNSDEDQRLCHLILTTTHRSFFCATTLNTPLWKALTGINRQLGMLPDRDCPRALHIWMKNDIVGVFGHLRAGQSSPPDLGPN